MSSTDLVSATSDAADTPASVPSARERLPFWGLVSANGISTTGNMLTSLAVPWFVLQTTGSAARTGLVAFATILPNALSGFFSGAIVDRLGLKRVSVLGDIASGVTVALVPTLYLTVGLPLWLLLLLMLAGATLDAPGNAARSGLIPHVAGRAAMPLERANSILQVVPRLAIFAGPPIAGALIAIVGPSRVLWVDAATFAVSAALVACCVPTEPRGAATPSSYLDDLRGGVRFMRDNGTLLLLATFAVANVLLDPIFAVVLPVLVNQAYGDATRLGLVIGAFGAGTVVGAVLYGVFGPRRPRRPPLLFSVVMSGAPIWVLAVTHNLAALLVAGLVMGLALGPISPIVTTLLHERTPPEMLGRVFGVLGGVAGFAVPFGVLIAGLLLESIGTRATVVSIATLYLVFSATAFINPAFKDIERPAAAP
jgi:MFS family permease